MLASTLLIQHISAIRRLDKIARQVFRNSNYLGKRQTENALSPPGIRGDYNWTTAFVRASASQTDSSSGMRLKLSLAIIFRWFTKS